jgi:hypothetical protein
MSGMECGSQSPDSGTHTRNELRVGVTGHRPGRLEGANYQQLRTSIREVLSVIASAVGIRQKIVLSSLAEGADRLVAQEALEAGYQLVCPLPFSQAEFKRDFSGVASRAEYAALLSRASRVIELDGSRETPERNDAAYAASGQYIVECADVVVAIWDGEKARGSGGTADIIRRALERGVPVVWIISHAPHSALILSRDAPGSSQQLSLESLSVLLPA